MAFSGYLLEEVAAAEAPANELGSGLSRGSSPTFAAKSLRARSLSLLSWNAGPRRDGVTSCIPGSFHVIVVQEAEAQYSEIAKEAEKQFHLYQGADQLILCHRCTSEPGVHSAVKRSRSRGSMTLSAWSTFWSSRSSGGRRMEPAPAFLSQRAWSTRQQRGATMRSTSWARSGGSWRTTAQTSSRAPSTPRHIVNVKLG